MENFLILFIYISNVFYGLEKVKEEMSEYLVFRVDYYVFFIVD